MATAIRMDTLHNTQDPPITFITGYPRSGTTLLANQLNRLRGVVVGPESQYFRAVYKRLKSVSGKQFVELVANNQRLADFGLGEEDIRDVARDCGFDRDRFLHTFLRRHAALQGLEQPALLLEKSPAHILHARRALACYPQAKFIYIVKDPRDVVNSNLQVDWNHSNIPKHCAAWNMYNDAFSRLQAEIPGRVYLLRFEDLVTDLRLQLRLVCQFLNLPYELDDGPVASAVPDWEAGWKSQSTGQVDPGKAFRWQRDESCQQHRVVSAMTRGYRALFRYDREPEGGRRLFLPVAWAYNNPAYKSLLRAKRVYL